MIDYHTLTFQLTVKCKIKSDGNVSTGVKSAERTEKILQALFEKVALKIEKVLN